MLLKLVISFLAAIAGLYLLFCMLLNTPIMGGGNAKDIDKDVKCRWFWVMSIYIGKIIMWGILLAIVIGISYFLIYCH
jgi:hypothetical protein